METEKITRRTALMTAHGAIAVIMATRLIEEMPGIDHEHAVSMTRVFAASMLNAGLAYASLVATKHAHRWEIASLLGLAAVPLALLTWAVFFTG